jgi:hypothetical protein
MMRVFSILVVVGMLKSLALGQLPRWFDLEAVNQSLLPASNVVNDLLVRSDTVWVASERGLSYTMDGTAWRHFGQTEGFKGFGISAVAIRNSLIWVAHVRTTRENGEAVPFGEGLSYSTNGGQTWTHLAQPVERPGATVDTITYGVNNIRTLAITITRNNITYDIALTSGAVWTANFAGMLRKSTDNGQTWTRVVLPPDHLDAIAPEVRADFDLSPTSGALGLRENLNHRVFSVFASNDSVVWVGTAGGINKSTDGGVRWRKFNHQNQLKPISGNFVVAINEQQWNGKKILWAATVNALDPDERRGLSFSEDGGESWTTTLLGEFVHNIAFKDSIVYAATDNGVYRSSNFGQSWIRSGTIADPTNLQRITSSQIYSVAAQGETIWVGGNDGMASTRDTPAQPFGSIWRVFRTYQPVGASATTYAYPTPFSPDDEVVRLHYSTQGRTALVTIRIFNFAMQLVRTVIQNAPRSGAYEQDEIWDGRDDQRQRVANGVYFYRVDIEGLDPLWGKIYVVE